MPTKRKPAKTTAQHAQDVTDQIIEKLEAGVMPWRQSWTGGVPMMPKRSTGQSYKGINVLILWLKSQKMGYVNPFWFTAKQSNDLGARIRRGAAGAHAAALAPDVLEPRHALVHNLAGAEDRAVLLHRPLRLEVHLDALHRGGFEVPHIDMPLTPSAVWGAIQSARGAAG